MEPRISPWFLAPVAWSLVLVNACHLDQLRSLQVRRACTEKVDTTQCPYRADGAFGFHSFFKFGSAGDAYRILPNLKASRRRETGFMGHLGATPAQ